MGSLARAGGGRVYGRLGGNLCRHKQLGRGQSKIAVGSVPQKRGSHRRARTRQENRGFSARGRPCEHVKDPYHIALSAPPCARLLVPKKAGPASRGWAVASRDSCSAAYCFAEEHARPPQDR